jgi:hypothetical protein
MSGEYYLVRMPENRSRSVGDGQTLANADSLEALQAKLAAMTGTPVPDGGKEDTNECP